MDSINYTQKRIAKWFNDFQYAVNFGNKKSDIRISKVKFCRYKSSKSSKGVYYYYSLTLFITPVLIPVTSPW